MHLTQPLLELLLLTVEIEFNTALGGTVEIVLDDYATVTGLKIGKCGHNSCSKTLLFTLVEVRDVLLTD